MNLFCRFVALTGFAATRHKCLGSALISVAELFYPDVLVGLDAVAVQPLLPTLEFH